MKRQRGHEEVVESNIDEAAKRVEDGDYSDDEEGDFDLALDESNRIADVGCGLDFTTRTCSDLVRCSARSGNNTIGDGDAGNHGTLAQLYAEARALDALDREVDLDSSFWLPASLVPATSAGNAATSNSDDTEQSESDIKAAVNSLCSLEKAALEIFRLHTANCTDFDPERSGAEWWVQVRQPSHHNATESNSSRNNNDAPGAAPIAAGISGSAISDSELEGESIQWHFDKDETLQAQFQVHCAPQLSTVTYLTDVGAPTVVLPFVCNSDGEVRQVEDNSIIKSGAELADASGAARASAALTPEEVNKGPATKAAVATLPLAAIKTKTESAAGFLSLPRRGKHLVFDGRFLHAAPVELRSLNSNHDKNNSSDQTNKNSNNSKIGAAKRSNDGSSKHSSSSSSSSASSSASDADDDSVRVTLLVNVWLHHQPFGIEALDREAAAAVAAAGVEAAITSTTATVGSSAIATATTTSTTAAAAAADGAASSEPSRCGAADLLHDSSEVVWDVGILIPIADAPHSNRLQTHTFPVCTSLGHLKLTCPFPTELPSLSDAAVASGDDSSRSPGETPSSLNSGSYRLLFNEGNMPLLNSN